MKANEMKIGEVVKIQSTGGKIKRLLPEKDIVEYLRSLKQCPFCNGNKITEKKILFPTSTFTCEECGFSINSDHLYHRSEIKEGMKTIKDVLWNTINEAVKKYEEELKDKIVYTTYKLGELNRQFALHVDKTH